MISAREAFLRLRDGNQRFAAGSSSIAAAIDPLSRSQLASGQEPFAIVLGCSDARVPSEIVFDQGLGDLFVIRVAGNIVAPSQVGSVEFAAEQFKTPLLVVLGHSKCGAVAAAIEQLRRVPESQSPNLRAIVERVKPAVGPLVASDNQLDEEQLLRDAVRANVRRAIENLRGGSELLASLVEEDRLTIVGGDYSLESGLVDFFDGLPEGW